MFRKNKKHRQVEAGLKPLFPRLWRYCLFLSGTPDIANDLAQSACLRALEKTEQFTSGTGLDKWVFQIAKNIWFNQLRAEKVRQGGGIHSVDEISLADSSLSSDRADTHRDIVRGVMSLPEAQRIAVGLVYVEGFSYSEASELLDIPIGTVMSRLAAARSSLKTKYKDYTREFR